jgi:hypothetical protein
MFLFKNRKRPRMTVEEADAIIAKSRDEAPLELEKNDIKAIIIAGLIVFVPFVLIFGGALYFVYWFIVNIWAM